MTTESISISANSHRVALLLGITGALLVALACSFMWAFILIGALAVIAISASENESFLLTMIFMVPFQWRLESGLPVASAFRMLFIFGFFLGRLLRWKVRGRQLLEQPLTRASLYFLGAGVASLIFGKPGWMEGAPEGIARLGSYIGFYFVVLSWTNTDERLRRVLGAITVSTIALAAFALVQVSIGGYTTFWNRLNPGVEDFTPWMGRPPSFLDGPNNFGFYLNVVVPICLACCWLGDAGLKRLGGISFCSGFIALFLTQSRGGLAAFAITLILAIFGLVKGRTKQLIFVAGLCLVTFLLYVVGSALSPEHLGGIEETSSVGRLILWGAAWNLFASSPWFGVGLWNFHLLYGQYFQLSWLPSMILGTASLYLQLLSETGVCGFAAFFGLVIVAAYNARRLQRSSDLLGKVLGFAALWSLCSVLIHGFVESPLENPQTGTMLWILFALIAAKVRLNGVGALLPEKLAQAISFNGLPELGS